MKMDNFEILDAKTKEKLLLLDKVEPTATILDIKALFQKSNPKWYPARQSLRLDPSKLYSDSVFCLHAVGISDRVRRPAHHLSHVLLPPPFHIFTQI
uniref:Trans-2,3-enoyl-CoA reductase-like n=1 Tax=Periophthalmus magnuspinnatus TaxID=409849 RepID=A0A3B4A173_9GOBI